MYTDETEKRGGFPLRDFLLKLILIIIFVLLLIWLVPWPKGDSNQSLKDQIFNANLQEMKEAGILYFTQERLPVNVGDRKTLTLQEMLELKLLIPFTDKDGKSCDITNSYITLEKLDDEYLMKVYLKCSGEEDYILVHLGCYAYCTSDICEKKEDPTIAPTTKPSGNSPKPTTTNKPTITPTYTPTTTPTTTPTITPTTTPTTTPTITPTITPDVQKEYEYKKHFDTVYSAWTGWKVYAYSPSDNIQFGKTATKEIEDLGKKKVQTGTQSAIYEYYTYERQQPWTIGQVEYAVCTNWKYIITTTASGGSKTIKQVNGDWYSTGQYGSGPHVPDDTDTTRYIVVGIDYQSCGDCVNQPYYKWRIEKRSVTTIGDISDSSTATKVTASCTQRETRKIDVQIQRTIVSTHKEKIEDEKPIYGYVSFYRIRTRQITQRGFTNYQWSSYNDQSLLKQGYAMTGKSRNKK